MYISNDGGKIMMCQYQEEDNKIKMLDQIS